MGLFDSIKKAAKRVKKAVKKVAEKVADSIETAGNKAQESANQLAATVANSVPYLGPAVGAAVEWAGAVVSGVADLAGAAVKAAASSFGGLLAGGLLILAGDFKNGIREMLSGSIGGVLLVVGKFVELVQIVFGVEARKRRLTKQEAELLKQVFRRSVSLFNVRIVSGRSGVFDFNDRAFTMGNTIYMKDTTVANWNPTLVHETVHVWQYQNVGSSYSTDALGAQTYYEHLKWRSAYDWFDAEVNDIDDPWEEWNREAQARFIEDIWTCGGTSRPAVEGSGQFYVAENVAVVGQFRYNGTTITDAAQCGTERKDYTPPAVRGVNALRGEVSVRDSVNLM